MMKHHPALANGAHSHRIREDERGSISPYLCIASGLLTMVALLVMLSLGDATLHRRDASNAADSAALAAAGAWADSIESAYDDAVGAGNADDLWGGVGNSVGSYAGPKARRAAETYASRNGATVTAYSFNAIRRTITVAVETNSAVEGVDERMTAESTAEIVLGNGVCLKGGKIGFTMDGRCVAKRPDEDPAPESTPSPSPTTAPFKVPDGMSEHARVTTRLVS